MFTSAKLPRMEASSGIKQSRHSDRMKEVTGDADSFVGVINHPEKAEAPARPRSIAGR